MDGSGLKEIQAPLKARYRADPASAGGSVHAAGDLYFRGTLGVDQAAPVGFREIRLTFDLDTAADADELATLIRLTERYCVVLQTIVSSPNTTVHLRPAGQPVSETGR